MNEPVNSAPCDFLSAENLEDLFEDSGPTKRLSDHLALCEFCTNALGQLSRPDSLASRELIMALSKTKCMPSE
jgi:hypothetical protein